MELSIGKAGMRNREQHVQGSWYLERGMDRDGAGESGSSYVTYGCVGHSGAVGLTLKHWGMIFRSVFRKINLLFLFFLVAIHSFQDLSSSTRDCPWVPGSESVEF